MNKYIDRLDAGRVLAHELIEYKNRSDVIVLALPRGGVPVGYEIATFLKVPLDIFIVRKLGVPGHPELAMGAMATGDVFLFNNEIISDLLISQSAIKTVIDEETKELHRRQKKYRGDLPFPSLKNKTIILVDDGIATGATMRVAIKALKKFKPTAIVVAVPVADQGIYDLLSSSVDKIICPLIPEQLYAVGAWYDDFDQTEDEEVFSLLHSVR